MSIISVNAGIMLQQLKQANAGMAPASEDIVNMDSNGGFLADFVPGMWGGERAGRSQAMAQASGTTPNFNVRHPVTSGMGSVFGGMALGGLTGAGLGGASGYGAGMALNQSNVAGATAAGAGIGAAGGIATGSIIGLVRNALARRKEMGSINEHYDAVRDEGGLNPEVPKFNTAATIFAPGRGPHRTGQLDGYEAISSGKSIDNQRPLSRDLAYSVAAAPIPYVNSAVSLGHQGYQNIASHLRSNKLEKAKRKTEAPKVPKRREPKPAAKAAAAYYAPAEHCNAFTTAIRQHEMQKQAELPSWQQFSADPMGEAGKQLTAAGPVGSSLGGAAIGGLVGAGLGGAAEMMKEKKDRDILRALLGGGVLGAGAGGLAGYAANRWAGQGAAPPVADALDTGYPAGQKPEPKPLSQGAKDMYGPLAHNAGRALGMYNSLGRRPGTAAAPAESQSDGLDGWLRARETNPSQWRGESKPIPPNIPSATSVDKQPATSDQAFEPSPIPAMSSITPPWLAGNQLPGDNMRRPFEGSMPPPLPTRSLGRPMTGGKELPLQGGPDPFQGFTSQADLVNMRPQDMDQAMRTQRYAQLRSLPQDPALMASHGQNTFGDGPRRPPRLEDPSSSPYESTIAASGQNVGKSPQLPGMPDWGPNWGPMSRTMTRVGN